MRAVWLGIQNPNKDFKPSVDHFVAKAGMVLNGEQGSSNSNTRSNRSGNVTRMPAILKFLPLVVFDKDSFVKINHDYKFLYDWLRESGWFSNVQPVTGFEENPVLQVSACSNFKSCSIAAIYWSVPNSESGHRIDARKSDILRRYLNIPDISLLIAN
jgi:hypothetical protein